jgi:mannitol 2-dehydrogenase
MKLQLLNGGHQVIAAPAEVLGLHTIADAMRAPMIKALFRKVALEEVLPHITPVPEITPETYVDLIDARFSNPAIVDTVRRVAFDGSSRHSGAVLPIIRTVLAAGTPIDGLALSQALWARMCQGVREDGSVIEANDPDWDQLTTAANAAKQTPKAWLEQRHIYGELAENAVFSVAFSRWLARLYSDGVEATLADYVAS